MFCLKKYKNSAKTYKNQEKAAVSSNRSCSSKHCSKNCPYLIANYNACVHPLMKNKGVILKQDEKGYIKICNKLLEDVKSEIQGDAPKKNKSKYGSHKITVDGITYDSEKEYRRHRELLLMQKAREIQKLDRQVPFVLIEKSEYGREIKYVADFVYFQDGKKIVEDVKSEPTKTPLYKLKKRLLAEKYGIVISEHM